MNINSLLETALWSTLGFSEDDSGNSDNLDANFSIDDVSDEFKAKCQSVMDDFMVKARHLFTDEELETGHIEHDLMLDIKLRNVKKLRNYRISLHIITQ